MWQSVKLLSLGLIVFVAAYAADQGNDLAYRIHGLIIMLVAGVLLIRELRNTGEVIPTVFQPFLRQAASTCVRIMSKGTWALSF